MTFFKNRRHAGQLLAQRLAALQILKDQAGVSILGLPRGGVPVAYEVAKKLGMPLDIFTVRKLGAPGHEECAMGAIASGNIRVLNQDVIDSLKITEADIAAVVAREARELARREAAYRAGKPKLNAHNRFVILVDDGLATGATMRAAIRALRQEGPSGIMVAVPVAPASTCMELRAEADVVICLHTPESFYGVAISYDDFTQTSDDEVRELLQLASPKSIESQPLSLAEL